MLDALPPTPSPCAGACPLSATASWSGSRSSAPLLAFRRPPGFVCVVNFGDQPTAIPAGVADGLEVLLSSEPLPRPGELPADSAVWLG